MRTTLNSKKAGMAAAVAEAVESAGAKARVGETFPFPQCPNAGEGAGDDKSLSNGSGDEISVQEILATIEDSRRARK